MNFLRGDLWKALEAVSNSAILASDSVIVPVTNINSGSLGECNKQVCNSCSKRCNLTVNACNHHVSHMQ